MLNKISKPFVNVVQRWLPDPFIFCILLTIVVSIISMLVCKSTPMELVNFWGSGVWNLLAFSMQMALVVVLGTAVATAPIVKKFIDNIASIPKTPMAGIYFVTIISTVCCWLNWGFGLIVGAILAKSVAKKIKNIDYRLLIASAYSGFVVWHAGLSGSIPLQIPAGYTFTLDTVKPLANGLPVTIENLQALTTLPSFHDIAMSFEQAGENIKCVMNVPLLNTVLAPWNLFVCAAILIVMPLINMCMHPTAKETFSVKPYMIEDDEEKIEDDGTKTPAKALENSMILSYITVILGVVYIVSKFISMLNAGKAGSFLDLNMCNLIFLVLGIAFHKTPIRYVNAINSAAKGAAGVILQFPFYAGIQGLMVGVAAASGVSLAAAMSNGFVAISNNVTFPLFTFLSAGIVNFFVPSGGGQWAVQGPVMMPAGMKLGISPALTCMGIAWGDAWTNLLQPFWALPALAVAKLGAKDIMGYCVIDLIVTGFIIAVAFLLVGTGFLPQ